MTKRNKERKKEKGNEEMMITLLKCIKRTMTFPRHISNILV
jgi:hypothetical protein